MKTGFDPPLHAAIARASAGVSPTGLGLAYMDWLQHLLLSPDKQLELYTLALQSWTPVPPVGGDLAEALPAGEKRFADPACQQWPFDSYRRNLLATQRWWQAATTGLPGVSKHHEDVVSFVARQLVDGMAPTNFPATNQLVLERTVREGGANLVRGAADALEDWQRGFTGAPAAGTDAFKPGRDVALTPGRVIFSATNSSSSSNPRRPPQKSIPNRFSSCRRGS